MFRQQKAHNHHKVDVVGDVHGCYEELLELLEKLGYARNTEGLFVHPEGRVLAFVGDLTDRGPFNKKCLDFAVKHVKEGLAYWSIGNHDDKLGRYLKGNPVKVGHGLGMTVDELSDLEEDEKKELSEFLLSLPLHVDLDDGNLRVCHAAPPPPGASKGKTKSVCLYGHTTGRTNERGFPERLNWVPAYNEAAKEDTPFVVYGHVTHAEPYVTEHACCIDTACFAGNHLSAFRWPEREVVQVESKQEWQEERTLVLHDQKKEKTPVMLDVQPQEIGNIEIPYLLKKLQSEMKEILYLIDTDELISKRDRRDGLVIANASRALPEPEQEHQLYAKGIVYRRNPLEVVSLPLLKIYNHGLRKISDDVTNRLEDRDDIEIFFPEKADGIMIQRFVCEDEVIFTTRSVMEGTEEDLKDQWFPFLEETRKIAEEKYPVLLDPEFAKNKTLIFEFIHPESRIVTDYGDLKDLILLSNFCLEKFQYETTKEVLAFADAHDLNCVDLLIDSRICINEGSDKVRQVLEDMEHYPEGAMACFEDDEQIVHRVKIKTEDYLTYFRLKYECTYKSVVNQVWNKPELHDWESFKEYLQKNSMLEEEIEDLYKQHLEKFQDWYAEIEEYQSKCVAIVESFENSHDREELGDGEFFKQLALHCRERYRKKLPHIMHYARERELPVDLVAWKKLPHKTFKAVLYDWRNKDKD